MRGAAYGSTQLVYALWVSVLLIAFAPLTGCDSKSGDRVSNLPPEVRITGGPPRLEDDIARDPYNVRIFWTGSDPDGEVDHYEYTIDPNPDPVEPVFTLDEIEDPESYLKRGELSLNIDRGILDNTDTLIYSKEIDGAKYSFSYIQTTEYSESFAMEASLPDSSGLVERKHHFHKSHILYLRAMDNEGRYSKTDQLEFTAFTLAPTAHIKFPNIENITDAGLTIGSDIRMVWTGVDLDQGGSEKEPVAYLYKIVDFNERGIDNFLDMDPTFLFTRHPSAAPLPWTYQSADTTEASFTLTPGHSYMFAVRAIDEAGAVQRTYSLAPYAQQASGNVAKFTSSTFSGSPILIIKEPTLGEVSGTGNFLEEFEVAPGSVLRFFLTGDASRYGGVIEGFSYGVDIQNLELEDGPDSEWSPWSSDPATGDIVFTKPDETHIIYIRTRDTTGNITMATLVIKVVNFTFERELLVVDDYRDTNWPLQQVHTDFWVDQLTASGRLTAEDLKPEILFYRAWGPSDAQATPTAPDLTLLGQYKMMIWEINNGNSGDVALAESGAQRRHLSAYTKSGGKFWITGRPTMKGIMPGGGNPADVLDDTKVFGGPGSFAYNTMRLYSKVEQVGLDKNNRMSRVEAPENRPVIWPMLDVDKTKVSRGANQGVPFCDVVREPLFTSVDPSWTPEIVGEDGETILAPGERLDSLYIYRAVGVVEEGRSNNRFDKGIVALRYTDSRVTRDKQHRTIWFGFPIYFMKDDDALLTIRNVIDWFREEELAPLGGE